jgi:exopolysaccharide production protein ExoQ
MQQSTSSPMTPLNPNEILVVRALVILFALFALLPAGLDWSHTINSSDTMEGTLSTKLEWGGIFLVSAILLMRHPEVILQDMRRMNPFLILVLLWCLSSVIWSPFPAVTLKRSIQLYGIVAMGLAIQLAPRPLELFLDYLLFALMGILVASFFVAVGIPSIGIDYELGSAWRGVLSQKNELGQVASLAVLLWQVRACTEKIPLRSLMLGIGMSLFMLVMAKSSTSILITVISSLLFHLLRRHHIASPYWITRVGLVLLVIAIIFLQFFYIYHSRLPTWPELSGPIAGLFGKGTDLTGRTEIWQLVLLEIQKHWVMGLGYASFWLGEGSLSSYVIEALYWIPLQSHNGYLDILNEQGLIGLGLAVLCLLYHALTLIRLGRYDRS